MVSSWLLSAFHINKHIFGSQRSFSHGKAVQTVVKLAHKSNLPPSSLRLQMMPPRLPGSQGGAMTRSRSSNRSSSGHHLTHTAASKTFHKRRRRRQQHHIGGSHMGLGPGSYLALLLLSTTCTLVATSSSSSSSAADTGLAPPDPPPASQVAISSSSPCAPQHWWDSQRDRCTPCTRCQGEMIPLRPCQLHTDTICGSIYDLKIDWVVLAKTEPNWKEVSAPLYASR